MRLALNPVTSMAYTTYYNYVLYSPTGAGGCGDGLGKGGVGSGGSGTGPGGGCPGKGDGDGRGGDGGCSGGNGLGISGPLNFIFIKFEPAGGHERT